MIKEVCSNVKDKFFNAAIEGTIEVESRWGQRKRKGGDFKALQIEQFKQ